MPPATAAPADVLDRRTRAILDRDIDGYADLFSPDGVIEAPFAARGSAMPPRLAGRENIREYTRQVMQMPFRIEGFEVTELYETQDPEVVITEVRAQVSLTATGQSFTATSIQVFRIRDGRILLFRDYANPQALEDALAHQR